MDAKIFVIVVAFFVGVNCQGQMRGGRRSGPPKLKGCSPPCFKGDMCLPVASNYKGRTPSDAVCIDMKGFPSMGASPVAALRSPPSFPAAAVMAPRRQPGLFGGSGVENLFGNHMAGRAATGTYGGGHVNRRPRQLNTNDLLMMSFMGGDLGFMGA